MNKQPISQERFDKKVADMLSDPLGIKLLDSSVIEKDKLEKYLIATLKDYYEVK